MYPKAVFPAERFIYVGEGWDGHRDSLLTGLRDPLSEAFRGEGCQGTRDIRRKGETLSIMDVSTADTLTIDPEGAMLFLDFEADEAIAEWNGAQHGKHRHGFSGIEYRRYVAYGLLSVAKGKEGQIDEILRRTAWRERMGLAGYNYDHERALGLSVAAEQRASQHGM